jgi:hypothetical protein
VADPDYFTLTEFRELPEMDDTSAYPEAKVLAAAAYFTSIVDNELGASLVIRSRTETLDGAGLLNLPLSYAPFAALTTVTLNGTSVTTSLLSVDSGGRLRYKDGLTRWSGSALANVVVVYTAGLYDACPDDVKDAVMWATRDRLLSQDQRAGSDARRTTVNTEYGTTTYVLPGEKRPTGYPELDAVLASRQRSIGPAAG